MIFENRAGIDSLIAAETVRTVAERIPHGRGHPDKPNYGVPNSVALHSNRPLPSLTTTSMTGIAYMAEGPLLSDLVAGRLHASFILE